MDGGYLTSFLAFPWCDHPSNVLRYRTPALMTLMCNSDLIFLWLVLDCVCNHVRKPSGTGHLHDLQVKFRLFKIEERYLNLPFRCGHCLSHSLRYSISSTSFSSFSFSSASANSFSSGVNGRMVSWLVMVVVKHGLKHFFQLYLTKFCLSVHW